MKIIFMFTMTMSIMFMMMKHPLSMGLILLMMTTIIALMTGLMSTNFWFSYILFIVMVGGMLVLFIYMTSIAGNEKFMNTNKILIMTVMFMILFLIMTLFMDPLMNYFISMNNDMSSINNNFFFEMSLNKYSIYPTISIFIMMIMYLLITLIAVVKITNISYGPLKQKM